jgi:cell division protein FtsW
MPYKRAKHSQHKQRRSRKLLSDRVKGFFSRLRPGKKEPARRATGSAPSRTEAQTGSPDKILLYTVVALCLFGWIMVYSGSFYVASQRVDTLINDFNPFHFFLLQGFWLVVSGLACYITYRINFRSWKYLSIPMLGAVLAGLIIVLLLPSTLNGAKSWILIGPFSIQPSEFAKPALIAYVAAVISRAKHNNTFSSYAQNKLIPFLLPTFLIGGLVLLGRDLASSLIIIGSVFLMFLFSDNSKIHHLTTAIVAVFVSLVGVLFAVLEPYRLARLRTYLKFLLEGEIQNPLSTGYQLNQILIAVGSGGIFGYGFGQSRQKYFYLQDTAFSDTIFAVVAEEFGTLGSALVIFAFALITFRGLKIAAACKDNYAALLSFGIVIWITLQAFVHLGVNVGLFPLTGVTLPFMSYGGSSLLSCMIGLGMLLNVSKEVKLD